MVLTLELPVRPASNDFFTHYERRFGALPEWLDGLEPREAKALARQALRRGTPLSFADALVW